MAKKRVNRTTLQPRNGTLTRFIYIFERNRTPTDLSQITRLLHISMKVNYYCNYVRRTWAVHLELGLRLCWVLGTVDIMQRYSLREFTSSSHVTTSWRWPPMPAAKYAYYQLVRDKLFDGRPLAEWRRSVFDSGWKKEWSELWSDPDQIGSASTGCWHIGGECTRLRMCGWMFSMHKAMPTSKSMSTPYLSRRSFTEGNYRVSCLFRALRYSGTSYVGVVEGVGHHLIHYTAQ